MNKMRNLKFVLMSKFRAKFRKPNEADYVLNEIVNSEPGPRYGELRDFRITSELDFVVKFWEKLRNPDKSMHVYSNTRLRYSMYNYS